MKKNILLLTALVFSLSACQKAKEVERAFDLYEVETFSAIAGDNMASLSWTLQQGKPNPQEFLIIWTPDLEEVTGGKVALDGTKTSYEIQELVNGYSYKVSIQARYENGLSQMKTSKITPKTSRFPVSDFVANAGSERVLLKWTKPETTRLTSYTISWLPGNGSHVITDYATEQYMVNGLTNGTEYHFSVVCNYPNGDSEAELASATPGVVFPIIMSSDEVVRFQLVQFEYNPMYFMAGDIKKVEWDFGGEATAEGTKVSYRFKTAGTPLVKCKVTYMDDTSESGESTITVNNYAWNKVALVSGAYTGYVKASSPVFSPDGSTLYISTSNGKGDLFAVDAYTGEIKWTFPIAKVTYGGGPAVGPDGTIYVGAQGTTQYAVKPSGEQKWAFTTIGNVEAFPAVTSDNKVYMAANGTIATLYQINGNTGAENWSKELGGGTAAAIAVDALGNVYAGTNSGIWSFTETGTQRWVMENVNVTERGSFAISGTTLYAALKATGGLIAVNMTTGEKIWQFNLSKSSDSYFPVVGQDGTIYFTSKGTKMVYAINSDGTKKWESGAIAAFIYNSPAVDIDGNVYAGTQANVDTSRKLVKFNGQTGVYTMTDDDQIMSAFTIGPDYRLYYGTVAGNIKTVETNGPASSWCMRGNNPQGTNSLK